MECLSKFFCHHEIEYLKKNVERREIEASVGMHSLVGIHGDPPYGHGNYFSFSSGPRCVNMWAENMNHLIETGVIDEEIEVELWRTNDKEWAVVVDDRAPDDYVEESPCFTGYGSPPNTILSIMSKRYGW